MGTQKIAWLAAAVVAASPVGYAATVVGPLNAVTAIDGLTFTDGTQSYDFNVSFVVGSYDSVYGSGAPTFENNASGGLAATNAIIAALTGAGATGVAGANTGQSLLLAVPTGFTGSGNSSANGTGAFDASPGGSPVWTEAGFASALTATGVGIEYATFQPVPLPAAVWFMLSGLGGLWIMARKRRAA